MKASLIFVSVFLISLPFSFAQTSDDELKLGVAAYKQSHYDQAIQHFSKAVELDPQNVHAHLYLATAHVSQYIPGVSTDENVQEAQQAITHYQRVLELNSDSTEKINAQKGIAYLYLNMKKWDDARKYYQMAADMDPTDPEPSYSIGVIDWSQCYQSRMEERANLGMRPDQQLSAKDPEQKRVCDQLQAKNWTVIEDGIAKLDKAIQLRPDYDDAMAYINLMYRERADLECEDLAARSRDLKTADDWVDKVMATKKARADKLTAPPPK